MTTTIIATVVSSIHVIAALARSAKKSLIQSPMNPISRADRCHTQ